jgi:hypothetical protein
VFTPGLADLFEAFVVGRAAAHSVKILRNKGMVIVRQGKPSRVLDPFVTRISSQSEADAASDGTIVGLLQANQITDDDIGAWNGSNAWHHRRLRLAVNKVVDLDRLHRGAGGDFSNDCPGIRWAAKCVGKLLRNK